MLFGRLIKVSRASDLGLHGRWSEKVVYVALTSKRLLIVSKNHKQEESAPLHSFTLGKSVRLGRDVLLRPIVEIRGHDRDMSLTFPWRDSDRASQVARALDEIGSS
jgi:hypothetical protein